MEYITDCIDRSFFPSLVFRVWCIKVENIEVVDCMTEAHDFWLGRLVNFHGDTLVDPPWRLY